MAEWLTLLLLVPAVVVPVVLLVGFAGCDRLFGLEHVDMPPPVIVSAEGKSVSVITLTWTYSGSAAEFEFDRMKLPEQTRLTFKAATAPHDDNNGLEPATSYLYRVRAIGNDGEPGEWSNPQPNIPGSTLPFETTFAWTAEEQARSTDTPGLQGYCYIQRIEAARLSKGGTQVKLTLRTSSVGTASIDAMYISRPDPAPGKDPYDSDADLTLVTSKVDLPANSSVPLPAINYNLDAEQPLLIAIDFSSAAPSAVRRVDGIVNDGASSCYKVASSGSAGIRDRVGFIAVDAILLVEKIEVG